MYLHDLYLVNAGEGPETIRVVRDKIEVAGAERSFPSYERNEPSLSFDRAIAFPGLINSHDHLDFNSFPPLRNGIYQHYTAWGRDIHCKNKTIISQVLNIPQPLRTQWGIYKNLLNGVTTVVNHGKQLAVQDNLITVFQQCQNLHSVRFEKAWRYKLNRWSKRHLPLVIHIGEGTDDDAQREIDELIRWNLLKRPVIGVHNVAMNERQAAAFKALVWCPASNYFLLDRTARINLLKHRAPVVFGTDSTLTGTWNLWEQLRAARQENMASDEELFDMLTRTPARIWGLPGCGEIKAGHYADLVVARMKETTALGSFFALNPGDILLVLKRGSIQLFDEELHDRLMASGLDSACFSSVQIGGRRKYVRGDLPALAKEICSHYAEAGFPFSIF